MGSHRVGHDWNDLAVAVDLPTRNWLDSFKGLEGKTEKQTN